MTAVSAELWTIVKKKPLHATTTIRARTGSKSGPESRRTARDSVRGLPIAVQLQHRRYGFANMIVNCNKFCTPWIGVCIAKRTCTTFDSFCTRLRNLHQTRRVIILYLLLDCAQQCCAKITENIIYLSGWRWNITGNKYLRINHSWHLTYLD